MSIGIFLWRAAICTFISNQPYYFNTSKWTILHLSTLNILSTIIFLLINVPFLITIGILFKFYLVIFLLHFVTLNLLNWYRLHCEIIDDHILISLVFWWLSKHLIILGNVHINPGPLWRTVTIYARDFIRIPLIHH